MRQFEYNFEGDDLPDQDEAEFFYEINSPHAMHGFPYGSMPMGFMEDSGFNHQLLSTAIQVCEKSWFWRFRSLESKLETIIKAYTILQRLTEIDFEEDEEDADL